MPSMMSALTYSSIVAEHFGVAHRADREESLFGAFDRSVGFSIP